MTIRPKKTCRQLLLSACLALLSVGATVNAVDRYVSLQGGHAPPFTDWGTAATNIQDAIDVAADGDTIWVTNGVYATGGKAMAGGLINRVALTKALTAMSMNGPKETVIQGQKDPVTSSGGAGAVRCAWLANGAVLSGFTLRNGATRSSGDTNTLQSGGGVWCASTNAVVVNCVISDNSAYNGGGSYFGTLNNCTQTDNWASRGGGSYTSTLNNCTLTDNSAWQGGGSYSGTLNNCTVTGNLAWQNGGGSYSNTLNNCAVTDNLAYNYGGGSYSGTLKNCTLSGNSALVGGGSYSSTLYNCIVWGNRADASPDAQYFDSTLNFTCSWPQAPGTSNISQDPQLLADGIHIAATSPCRTNGSILYTSGTDIDGQQWVNPPSMGCDQWRPQPAITTPLRWQLAPGFSQAVQWTVGVVGQEPCYCKWTRDGVPIEDGPHYGGMHAPNLLVRGFGPADAGAYQVVVSNAFGVVTSQVARVVVHCVDAAGIEPSAPYASWATAATNIQSAIDAAAPGALILVTNGLYDTGGKVMAGQLTNRVVLNKAVTVCSMNGPAETVIQGEKDLTRTNGLGAVRCAWLTNGALLQGFTLRGGATSAGYETSVFTQGGGVWCASTNAKVAFCLITDNTAADKGGGSYSGTLNNCILIGNTAAYGGGAVNGFLNGCSVVDNTAFMYGGGSYSGTLNNCTLTGNSALVGGGSYTNKLNNCIVWGNSAPSGANYALSTLLFSCSPGASGNGNISQDPQLLSDGIHIAATSPCRTNGNPFFSSGSDIDGQPWATRPEMGCDQWHPQPAIVMPPWWQLAAGVGQAVIWTAGVVGQEPYVCWWTRDGVVIEDGAHYDGAHTTNLLVRGFGPTDAGAYQVVVSNAFGVATSQVARLAVHCVDAAGITPRTPYTSWATAATTIQSAIDAAAPGALILVTNGVYATGGKVKSQGLTNRIALDKAVTVSSVNGPEETVIQGHWDPATNGPAAIRCAWMTDGAVLNGFTLQGGATLLSSFWLTEQSGGGVWCYSTNAVVENCIITGNAAFAWGGGAYSGTLTNCTLTKNWAYRRGGGSSDGLLNHCTLTGNSTSGFGGGSYSNTLNNCTLSGNSASSGGGSYSGILNNCILTGNSASSGGGGSYQGTLNNCTLTDNSASSGGGSYQGTLNNCIVWNNQGPDYSGGTLSYTCALPQAPGTNNIGQDPQLLADGIHIAYTSPCRTNGSTNYTSGTDIDGQTWAKPPSMGCDQWSPQPAITIPPQWKGASGTGQALLVAIVAGQAPFDCWWTKDGVAIEDGPHYGRAHTTNLLVRGFGLEDAQGYQVVVSNVFGMATSPVTRVEVHCVDALATASLAPYTNWETAAITIQAAIDVAAPGSVIVVTNGLYATGGKAMSGGLTNRVALDKAVTVLSVNGPAATVIEGRWNSASTTNGPGAVRCAWLTYGAALNGFTLRGGATLSAGAEATLQSGGGVWCESAYAVVANCVITGNSAYGCGGGSYSGTLNNCVLTANSARNIGGGSYSNTLNNCALSGNSASSGGGSYQGRLINCTLTRNSASISGGGSYSGMLTNCIVWGNTAGTDANYSGGTLRYTCARPLASGMGNRDADPLLLADGVHIAYASPCRTNGSTNYTSGTDIDGQTWAKPPSMGCDQWHPEPIIIASPRWQVASGSGQALLSVDVAGQAPFDCWWTKDGVAIEEGARYSGTHTTNLLVRGFGLEDAQGYQVVVSNAFGMATNLVMRVEVHCVDAMASASLAPYTSWATAATNIQAAIDAAAPGALILVTNGVYATGGKVVAGNLTNRVALNKAVTVLSVNGPAATVIEGRWNSVSTTNGPGAVRCAWLTNGAALNGFTLRGGATLSAGAQAAMQSGGGVWCANTNAVVANCVITSNSASQYGGGSYSGTLNNCALAANSAGLSGGGSYQGTLNNCTVTGNLASIGGGSSQGTNNNCILWGNAASSSTSASNYVGGVQRYTCSSPKPAGTRNLDLDPQLLADGIHIAITSPCRGAGAMNYVAGTDIDGETWAYPPSMGCDEVWDGGPIGVAIAAPYTEVVVNHVLELTGWIAGQVSRVDWSFGDGSVVANAGVQVAHAWTNLGNYTVTFTAYNPMYTAGVSTNLPIQVVPLAIPTMSAGGFSGDRYRFTFGSQVGVDYFVDYATNLVSPVNWQLLLRQTGVGGGVEVEDQPTEATRFYRVRIP